MTGWRKRTIMEMAKEAEFELDCVSLEWHKRIETFAKLVREDALAQPAPVQEPVAILNHAHGVYAFRSVNLQGLPDGEYQVYTTPPAQPAPVAWMEMVVANLVREGVNKHKARELAQHFYTPPQRTWVGLTDEDIRKLAKENIFVLNAIIATNAKLKEKNTP